MAKLHIIESLTDEIVHTVEVAAPIDSRKFEQVMAGMLRRIDTDRYHVREEDSLRPNG